MIEAHTLDAWTRTSDRTSAIFRDAMVLAGFAAPLFLWLAGVALVLAAEAAVRRGESRRAAAESVCRRGLEIFILAFLFRVQAFIVSPGAHPITLFRVDILNIMGPAITAGGVIWLLMPSRAAASMAYASVAGVIAMLTPVVRTAALIDYLPIWLQWYVRPAGDNTTFTGFPWTGFVFAGAAVGVLLAAGNPGSARRLHGRLLILGGTLVALGFYAASLPSIYRASSFWTTSPTFFLIRAGVLTMALSSVYFIEQLPMGWKRARIAIARMGRHSLFVYWIHVELVYGYASWPLHRRLPFAGAVAAYVAFTALIYGVVVASERAGRLWHERRQQMSLYKKVEAV